MNDPWLEVYAAAEARQWPIGLLKRAAAAGLPAADVLGCIEGRHSFRLEKAGVGPEDVDRYLDAREALVADGRVVREATMADTAAVAELFANSTEDVDGWDVVAERGPDAYAQFRLQENFNMQVVEDHGKLVAAAAHSVRNTYIDGQRITVLLVSAWRVHDDHRGRGLSQVRRMLSSPPAVAWLGVLAYYFVRRGNAAAQSYVGHLREQLSYGHEDQLEVAVTHLAGGRPAADDGVAVRPARATDLERCVEMINTTHDGHDLFRPLTAAELQRRLDGPWGPRPRYWPDVYGWDDFMVVERAGELLACAGLWDRGRDIRERWTHRATGDTRTLDPTAVLDWGFASSGEMAMAGLLRWCAARSHELGRSGCMVALQNHPAVDQALEDVPRSLERRSLEQHVDHTVGETDLRITRPYVDLSYW